MKLSDIISKIYEDKKLDDVLRRLKSRYTGLLSHEDLKHDVILEISKMPQDKIENLYNSGSLTKYTYGIASILCSDKRTQFAKNNTLSTIVHFDEPDTSTEYISNEDRFYSFCETIATGTKFPEATRLSAKIVQGYLLYVPEQGKKSYREFQKQSNIHFCSTASAVKTMRELFIKHEEKDSISI